MPSLQETGCTQYTTELLCGASPIKMAKAVWKSSGTHVNFQTFLTQLLSGGLETIFSHVRNQSQKDEASTAKLNHSYVEETFLETLCPPFWSLEKN